MTWTIDCVRLGLPQEAFLEIKIPQKQLSLGVMASRKKNALAPFGSFSK